MALGVFLGLVSAALSWWIGLVWFQRVWPSTHLASLATVFNHIKQLANPDAEDGFLDTYRNLLRCTAGVAVYRIAQSIATTLPIVLGLWVAWIGDQSWVFIVTTTLATLALGIRSLINWIRKTGQHVIDSQ